VRLAQYDKIGARNDFAKAQELGAPKDIVDEWLKKAK
jgi:hypothetical protein